ncbi:MAG: two-component regulator propeller domain-containing protein [Pyrinomonadaceae bacterium]|nr:two-component regulator propeller domain-containing protein [Pyrinomonadaceae bacterium]
MRATNRLSLFPAAKLAFAFLFIFSVFLPARPESLPLRVFTSGDGLATSVIHTALMDSDGFLWFGGRGGLSRLDGNGFTSFSIDDAITAPLVHALLESRDGRYFWIAADEGLYRVAKDRDAKPAIIAEKSGGMRRLNAVRIVKRGFWVIHEEPDGTLLAGSSDGLHRIRLNGDAEAITEKIDFNNTLDLVGRSGIRDFAVGPDGTLWAAADAGLVRRTSDGRWITYELPRIVERGMESYAVMAEPNGLIWLTARTGAHIMRPGPEADLAGVPDASHISVTPAEVSVGEMGTIEMPANPGGLIRLSFMDEDGTQAGEAIASILESIHMASDGRIYVPTRRGLYVFNNDSYIRYRDERLLPDLSRRIIEDRQGDLWFGTFAGLIKMERRGLTSFLAAGGFPEPNIHSIHESPDGRVLISHGTWRMSVFDRNRPEHLTAAMSKDARFSWTSFPLVPDSTGAVWALETTGLFRFPARGDIRATLAGTPKRFEPVFRALENKAAYRAFTDSKGRLYVGLRGPSPETTLVRIDPVTGEWEDLSAVPGIPPNRSVASFAEDKLGRIWFGFYGGDRVVRHDGSSVRVFSTEDGLPEGNILAMHTDAAGRIWLGSNSGGLAVIEDPTAETPVFRRFRQADGMTSDNIRCITSGADGMIYAGTVRGVSVIDPKSGTISRITTLDGLAADFVQAAFRDSRGTLWFGTSNGLSRYDVREKAEQPLPQVWISDVRIAGNRYNISEFGQSNINDISVSYAENNAEISFITNGEAGRTRFQYMIEGSGASWSAPSEQASITLANLSPGDYSFLVRPVTEDLRVGEAARMSLKISPPFWRTWWFAVITLLFAGAMVFALDRYRVRKTRQVESALAMSVESETRFRTLANTANDVIVTIDEDSVVVFVNDAVERVFGHRPEDLIGKEMSMMMPERMRDGHHSGIKRYISSGKRSIPWSGVSLPGLHKDGHEIPLELSFGEFERDGKRYFTGIARDISDRVRAERALNEARQERLRELERVRTRIATDLHDDIGSSLTQIAVLSEVAKSQAGQIEAANLTTPLERIKTVSKELVAVMSDIVWAINPQKDNLHDLVLRMRRFGSDVFTSQGVGFEFNAPEPDGEMQLGANIRREVFAIYKEAVNNAVKYSECRHARCTFTVDGDRLRLEIADDGKGFDTSAVLSPEFKPDMGGNGLASILRRAADLEGTCRINSVIGKGTTVTLTVPLHVQRNGDHPPI